MSDNKQIKVASNEIDLGNGESLSRGVFEVPGGFLALAYSSSKMFKTRAGAEKWLAKRCGK